MSESVAVRVGNLTKTFKIPLEASNGLKQKSINFLKGIKGYREFTPLNDVSFDINEGDFFGIVGRNGSGKSTLLKTIAGIYTPTKGGVHSNGSIVPFIELGVGFNPDLTGRENVFLNGALLGFSHSQMEDMFDEIVKFAELENFMDERLKNYSSGMQVRLAFSIAIKAQGDILLLDEVLAVGDEAFQRKCYEYFESLKKNKKTVILVTHDMGAVERFCNRAMFLNDGRVELVGSPHEVANAYSKANNKAYIENKQIEDAEDQNKKESTSSIDISLYNSKRKKARSFIAGSDMYVKLKWKKEDSIKHVGVAIFNANDEYIYGTNTFVEGLDLNLVETAEYKVNLNIAEGEYYLKVGLFGDNDKIKIDFEEYGSNFTVSRNLEDSRWGGFTKLKSEWL